MTDTNVKHSELVKTTTQDIIEAFTYMPFVYIFYHTQEKRDAIHEVMNSHPEWRFVWSSFGMSVRVFRDEKVVKEWKEISAALDSPLLPGSIQMLRKGIDTE